jgi:cbb3-type cytochrome oxidase subunit 3
MMKEVVRGLDPGILPQIGLIAFVVAFILVVIYAVTLGRKHVAMLKQLPLDD